MDKNSEILGRMKTLRTIFLIAGTIILILGFEYYLKLRKEARSSIEEQLKTMVELKASEINNWISEREADAVVFAMGPSVIDNFEKYLETANERSFEILTNRIKGVKEHYEYSEIYLLDTKGKILLSIDKKESQINHFGKSILDTINSKNLLSSSDLYFCPVHKFPHLDAVAPIKRSSNGDLSTIGFVLLRSNPKDKLEKLIQKWPSNQKTAETLLIKVEGDSIVFMNDLKEKPNMAFHLRVSLRETEVVGVKAALGKQGIQEGKDYSGDKVLSYSLPINNGKWILLSKMDKVEIFAPLTQMTRIFVLFVFMIFSGVLVVLIFLRNRFSMQLIESQYNTELERKALASHYEYLLKNASDIIILARPDGKIVNANDAACKAYGYELDKIVNKDYTELGSFQNPLKGEPNSYYESLHKKSDGSTFPVEISSQVLEIEGEPFLQAVIRDITERKKTEKILQESETRFSTLFQQNPSPIGITRVTDFSIVDVNDAWCRMTGYSKEDVIGKTTTELKLTYPDSISQIREKIRKQQRISNQEISILTQSGQIREVVMSSDRLEIGGEGYFISSFSDVTELKHAERESNEVRQLFQFLFSFSPVAYSLGSLTDRRIVDVNAAWENLFGYSKGEVVGRLATDFEFWQSQKDRDTAFENLNENGRLLNYEVKILTKSGEKRSATMYAEIVEQNKVKYIFSVFVDVTEREHGEVQKANLIERLNLATSSSQIGIWDWNIQKNELIWDKQMYALYGINEDEFGGAYEAWLSGVHPDDRESTNKVSENAVLGVSEYDTEFRVLWPDGSVHWLKANGKVIRNEKGEPLRMLGVNFDITDRKQKEDTLKKLEYLLSEGQKIAHMGTFEYIVETQSTYWSAEEYSIYGLNPDGPSPSYEEMLQKCIYPDDVVLLNQAFAKALQSNSIYDLEHRILRPDGSVRWVHDRAHPYFDQNGKLVRYVGTTLDITKQKQTESKLRQEKEKLDKIAASVPGIIHSFHQNHEGRVCMPYASAATKDIYGFDPHDIADDMTPVFSKISPEDIGHVVATIEKSAKDMSVWNDEFRYQHPTKGEVWLEGRSMPVKNQDGTLTWHGYIADVTDRKNSDERIKIAFAKYKTLFDNFPMGITVSDKDGNIVETNSTAEKLLGISAEEQLQRQLSGEEWKIIRTDGSIMPVEEYASVRALTEGEKVENVEMGIVRPDNSVTWINVTAAPIQLDGYGVVVTYNDITERKKAKLDLESSESKFRSIAENLTDVIAITDDKGIISYISPASNGVFGYSSEEMTGKSFGEFLVPSEREPLANLYKEHIESNITSHNLLIKAMRKNGDQFYAEISSSKIIEDEGISGRLALIRDVTETRLSEIRERSHSRILQMLTEKFSLEEILHEIQKSIEEETPDSICTILLMDKTGKNLRSLVPNQLPDFYNKAIDGAEIGMGRGSCGTAAFTGESVFVDDVFTHPYWEPFKELAKKANIVSCWSKPVISFNGRVLGTFAIYGRNSKLPNKDEIARIDYAANLTRLAIEKRTSEEELLASISKLKAIFDNAPVGISLIDNKRNLLDSNNMLADIIHMDEAGIAEGAYQSRKYIREDGTEMPVSELASTRAITEQQTVRNVVKGIVLESGETIWTQVSAAPLGEDDSRFVVITQDITDRKQAIAALEENEHRLRKVLETTSDGFWIVDSNRRFVEVNEAYCKMSGYTRDELMKMSITDLEALESEAITNERIQRIFQYGSDRFDTVHRRKDGSLFNVEVSVNIMDHEQALMICFCRDITERKVTEKDLLESEKRFSTIFEDSPVAIAISNLNNGKVILVNNSAIELFGFSLEEFIGNTTLELGVWANPDDRQRLRELVSTLQRVEGMETVIKLKSGEKRQVLVWGELLELAGEHCVMVEIIDITERKRAEQQLRERETELSNAQELAKMASWRVDLSNYQLTVSENYKRLLDIDDEDIEITFDFFTEHIHPDDADLMNPARYNLSPESAPVVFDFRMILPDKSIRWFQNTMVGEFLEGKLVALKGTNIDITEKKNKEEEIRKINETLEQRIIERTAELGDLYDNAPCGYHSLAVDGVFERVNATELNWLGYSSDELVGKLTALDLLTEESKEIFRNTYPKFKQTGKMEGVEVEFVRKDGSVFPVLLNATAVYDENGNFDHSRSTIIDHTDRKKAEEAMRLAQMEAEKANVAKSEFLSRMSHELRTPMNSILGFAQLLEMGELNPGQKKGVTHIMKSGKHLLDLINEVLDISRIEAGRLSLSPEPVQISGVVQEMMDIVRQLANERKITIERIDSPANDLFVKADRQRLKQVLLNLINNAIKYNREGGSIVIKAEIQPPNTSNTTNIRITVSDTGYGISEKDIHNIFVPFERIGAEKTETEGTGLGLAVVKKLMDAMGGEMGVESTVNVGSSFWIELPKTESQIESMSKNKDIPQQDSNLVNKQGTILYVEDNISNFELVEQIISTHCIGIRLITTTKGMDATSYAKKHKPDLILLDLNLPDIHGSEVLTLLQNEEEIKNIPVIIISADAMPQQLERLINAGAKNYLTKPLDVREFLEIINRFIRER